MVRMAEYSFSYDIATYNGMCVGMGVGNVCAPRATSYGKDDTMDVVDAFTWLFLLGCFIYMTQ